MKLHRPHDESAEPVEDGPSYEPRHLRLDVPADASSETLPVGGTHARRRGLGVLGRLARGDVHTA